MRSTSPECSYQSELHYSALQAKLTVLEPTVILCHMIAAHLQNTALIKASVSQPHLHYCMCLMSQQQHTHCHHSPLAHQLQEQQIFTNSPISTSLLSRSIYYLSPPEYRYSKENGDHSSQ
jgi:hypothetical protein